MGPHARANGKRREYGLLALCEKVGHAKGWAGGGCVAALSVAMGRAPASTLSAFYGAQERKVSACVRGHLHGLAIGVFFLCRTLGCVRVDQRSRQEASVRSCRPRSCR